ncbi:hypothetical protein [Romboutsia sp.]|uniref:hypothetical protein n=1 Tax=Romboutsia sp. TaxID=1965302 RepID=UPI003F3AA7ED
MKKWEKPIIYSLGIENTYGNKHKPDCSLPPDHQGPCKRGHKPGCHIPGNHWGRPCKPDCS